MNRNHIDNVLDRISLWFRGGVCGAIFIVSSLLIAVAACAFLFQIYVWLKKGIWPPMPIHSLFSYYDPVETWNYWPTKTYLGINKLAKELVDWPLPFVGFILGIAGFCFSLAKLDSLQFPADKSKRR